MPRQASTATGVIEPASLRVVAWSLMAFGALLRIASWRADASLFVDEAMVTLNIAERSWLQLLEPLNYNQAAPLGFLWLQKATMLVAGDSERAVRLIPLLASLIALPLFDRLTRRWLPIPAALVALATFAFALPLILFAAEAKPYSIDVAVAIVTLLFADTARTRGLGGAFGVAFAAWGALAIWLSYPGVILMATVGLVRVAPRLRDRDFRSILRESPVYGVWVAALALHWFLIIQDAGANPFFTQHFGHFKLPLLPTSLWELRALMTGFFRMFLMVLGMDYPGLAAFAFAIGWWALARRNLTIAALVTTPIVINWVLSNRDVYPFEGRLILYLAPMLCLVIGAGAWELVERTRGSGRGVAVVFLIALLAWPFDASFARLRNPREREEIRPVLEHVAREIAPDDTVYVYYGAQYAYRYYSDRLGLPDELELDDYVISVGGITTRGPLASGRRVVLGPSGRRNFDVYLDDLERLHDRRRVWFVFSHVWTLLGTNEQDLVTFHLERLGAKRLDEVRETGAAAFLYDLDPSGEAPVIVVRPPQEEDLPSVAAGPPGD